MGRPSSGGKSGVGVGVGSGGESTAVGMGSEGNNKFEGDWGSNPGNDWASVVEGRCEVA